MSFVRLVLLGAAVLGIACSACSCYHQPSQTLKRESLVGEYVYYCDDSGAPHAPDRLTLKADGRYVLVHVKGGHPASTEEGTWQLWGNLGQPQVAFGKTTYPIEVKGKHVRLVINDDLGHYYEKTR